VGLRFKRNSVEHRLRAAKPRPSDELVNTIKGELESARPAARRRLQPQLRLAGVTSAFALGLLAIGGIGYAMNYASDFVTRVTHQTIVGTRTSVRTVVLNAANDQYSTTTTQTTTQTTTTTSATTVSSDGSKSTEVQTNTQGSITVAPPTDTTQQTQVSWSPTTFSTPVNIVVDPTPPIAAPAFAGPASDSIISIVVTDPATGAVIHNLAAPLEIVFPNAPKDYVPAFSEDGVNFKALAEISGPPLPANAQDGFYRVGNDIHILTRHLTDFAVLYKANYTVSESGRKTQPAGSGKFGDPTRMHIGAPNVDVVGAPVATGNDVALTFFVDEQAALYIHVLSNGVPVVMGDSSTIRKHTIGGKSRKTFHLVILRPGTIDLDLHVPRLTSGSEVQLTFVDYDGHKVSKTVAIK